MAPLYIILIAGLLLLLGNWLETRELMAKISTIDDEFQRPAVPVEVHMGQEMIPMPQTLQYTYTGKDGGTHTVTTPRLDGESADDWVTRHQEAVAALQAVYPPA